MQPIIKKEEVSAIFRIGLLLKGLSGVLELVSGILVLSINKAYIITYVLNLLQSELTDDPRDFIANFIVNAAAYFSVHSAYFFAFYLFIHGVVKIFIIINILRKKLWAYPLGIAVFSAFIGYEFYRLYFTHSPWILGLTIFDIIIVALTIRQYKIQKRAR